MYTFSHLHSNVQHCVRNLVFICKKKKFGQSITGRLERHEDHTDRARSGVSVYGSFI